jgi:hypothetical protein
MIQVNVVGMCMIGATVCKLSPKKFRIHFRRFVCHFGVVEDTG